MRSRTIRWGAFVASLCAIVAFAGLAIAADRNDDNIPDRWEKRNDLSLRIDQARRDQDSDELRNRAEFRAKTDPRDADTDGDGIEDGEEGAGTVQSFDEETGELVINLFGGSSVTGTVDERTLILCGCRGPKGGDEGDEPDAPEGEEGAELRHMPPPPPPGELPEGEDVPEDPEGAPLAEERPIRHGHGRPCETDVLVEGAVVHQAELRATADGLVYTVIRLVKAGEQAEGPVEGTPDEE